MKICITAQGPTFEDLFELHFARAPYFFFFDTENGTSEAIQNGLVVSEKKIGQNAVQLLLAHGVDAVITGKVGNNAQNLLRGAGITLYIYQGRNTVRGVFGSFHPGKDHTEVKNDA